MSKTSTPISPRKHYRFKHSAAIAMVAVLSCLGFSSRAAVNITTATGGTNICSNTAVTGSVPGCAVLGPIVVAENLSNDIIGGGAATSNFDTLRLVPPAGWQFCGTMPALSFTAGNNILSISGTVSATDLTVIIEVNKNNKFDDFTITGLQVQPLTTSAPNGFISASTAYNIPSITTGVTNFGNLSITPAPIAGITTVCEGSSITLTDPTVGGTWVSSAGGVATVSSGGTVYGVTAGLTDISYTVAGCVTQSTLSVSPAPVISGSRNVCLAATTILTATPTGGAWASLNMASVLINPATGSAFGNGVGSAVIRYTLSPGCIVTTTVNVNTAPGPISGSHYACSGQIVTLTDGTAGGSWISSAPAIVAVNSANGDVTGSLTPGTATISYSTGVGGACTVTYVVTVSPLPLGIVGSRDICRGLTTSLTDPTPGGTWFSATTLVATVTSTGIVRGVNTGNSAIEYTLPTGCKTTAFVTVHEPPAPVTGPDSLCEGTTITLNEGIPGGTWSSSSTAVATTALTPFPDATIYGVSGGTVSISYIIPGCPAETHSVKVNGLPHTITGLASICRGVTTTLVDSTPGGSWIISPSTVALISPTGAITDLDTTLGATALVIYILPSGCSTSLLLTVADGPKPITGTDSVCQGSSVTLVDSIAGGIWSSTDLSLARVIDTSGVVEGIVGGMVNISYTLGNGCYSEIPFKVITPTPAFVNIAETPGTRICAGTPITFTASTVNAGIATYQWQVFFSGTPLGTGGTFTYSPIHGDVIVVKAVAHGVCAVSDTVYDTVAVDVDPIVGPAVTITQTGLADTLRFDGQVFTFHSSVVGGGTAPVYHWYVNGAEILGANSGTFAAALYGDATVMCKVKGNAPCSSPDSAFSNSIFIYGRYLGVNSVSQANTVLSLFPNPNNGTLTLSGAAASLGNNNLDIEVSDMVGHVVYKGSATAQNGTIRQQVSLGDSLPAGSYLLRATSGAVNEVFHFVVSK